MNHVPRETSDITLAWLNDVLEPEFGSKIVAFESEIIGGGAGVLGELARVTLSYASETDAPRSLVAKFASPVEEARQIAGDLGLYEMETRFYSVLADKIDIRMPECYYNDYDPNTFRFTMLLSDVAGEVVDQVAGCSPARAETTVREIAKLHAFGHQTNWRRDAPWIRQLNDPDWLPTIIDSLTANIPASVQKMRDSCPAWLIDLLPDFPRVAEDCAHRLCSFPKTLIHGDLRADNLIFDNQEAMTLLDWQLVFDAPGAYDIAYFLSQSLTIEDRRSHGARLIECYQQELEALEVGFDRKTFDEVFQLATLYCLAYPLTGGAVIDENFDRSLQLITAMLERSCAAVEDYGCLDLI